MDFLASKNLINYRGLKKIPFLHRQSQKEHLGPVHIKLNKACSGKKMSHKDTQRLECQADLQSWEGMDQTKIPGTQVKSCQNYRGRKDR